jgi:hypothetical protein
MICRKNGVQARLAGRMVFLAARPSFRLAFETVLAIEMTI